eukprot:8897290-Pyramimonas_sp.AAC.1
MSGEMTSTRYSKKATETALAGGSSGAPKRAQGSAGASIGPPNVGEFKPPPSSSQGRVNFRLAPVTSRLTRRAP